MGNNAYARETRLMGLKDSIALGIRNAGASVLLRFFTSVGALVALPQEQGGSCREEK